MTTPLAAAHAVTKLPAQDLDRAVADLRARGLTFESFDFGNPEFTDQIVIRDKQRIRVHGGEGYVELLP